MTPQRDERIEFDHLREELHQLEHRVDALEHLAEGRLMGAAEIRAGNSAPSILAHPGPAFELSSALHNIQIAGIAMLGIAGAFLLRALADSGAAPRLLAVAIAILYAAAWLLFSRRTRKHDAFATATYGVTAALILTPLLWEVTVRFQLLPPPITACILVGFFGIAFFGLRPAIRWSGRSDPVTTVMTLAVLLTALVLMVQTGDLVPFAVALLVVAGTLEIWGCRGDDRKMRIPAALAADLGVWLILYTMTRATGVPESYRAVDPRITLALGAVLFAITAASIVWRTAVLRYSITSFEMVQSAAAFMLSAGGALQITQGRAAPIVGVLAGIACIACYFAAFERFAESPRRAHHVLASWGLALTLAATFLLLPASALPATWSAIALAATLIGAHFLGATLLLHGAVYLVAAALTFGLPFTMFNAFTAARLAPATSALWIVAISAVGCCVASYAARSGRWRTIAGFVTGLVTATSAGALIILVATPGFSVEPTASLLATVRTLVICAVALAFGLAGARTGRRELVWISYVSIASGALKLVLEDFRQSHAGALAVSLICYGALLILVPRIGRRPASER